MDGSKAKVSFAAAEPKDHPLNTQICACAFILFTQIQALNACKTISENGIYC
jgi:hypothetical protein